MSNAAIHVPHSHRAWLYVLVSIVFVFLLVPIFIVIPMSFSDSKYLEFPPEALTLQWYRTFFGSNEWLAAARNSLSVAAVATLISVPVGVGAAYALNEARGRLFVLLRFFLLLPQLIPVVLAAIGVFFLYIRLNLVNTFAGIVVAHSALCIPFVVITVGAGLKTFDKAQENAARTLGASRLRAFWDVTVPQIRLSIIAAVIFSFITSFDEVVIGLFVAGGSNTLLTRLMFLSLRDQLDPVIAAISSILIVSSVLAIAGFVALQRPGREAAR
ncbi:MAG: ABC transporter permease [Rhizobiales bacterium]|nr:ABC transporter permease [Hyphomicrobiales bacterium]